MTSISPDLEEEILRLYREPIIGASYGNTYGEENLKNLVEKYRSLEGDDMQFMAGLVTGFSQSMDLGSSFISVGVLHALGMKQEVDAAYAWANTQDEAESILSHFDIGKSLADYFIDS